MAKQKKNQSNGKHGNLKNLYIALAIIVILFVSFLAYEKFVVGKEQAPLKYPLGYNEDTCRCVERNRMTCMDGFKLNAERRLCMSDSNSSHVTNVI